MAQSDAQSETESGAEREERIRGLFKRLDVKNRGQLDRDALREGFRRINHPLQNADSFLDNVMSAADMNSDGVIEVRQRARIPLTQYHEFEMFIIATERELRRLFDKIDTSRNGKLEFEEVRHALELSGIAIHPSILRSFFDSVDSNHDGVIEFNEWRDFLLLVPLDKASIKNVFNYYQQHAQTSSEGDAFVSYDTLHGFGFFIAGGTAGAVSRTATAPFDRLKTYLIASTGNKRSATGVMNTSMKAAENGQIGKAIQKAGSPLIDAVKSIYRLGGIRSFFVG